MPIDIGKNVHWFAGYADLALQVVRAPKKVRSNKHGYQQFRTWLRAQLTSGCYAPVIVGHEPTGIYHETWAHALQRDFADQIVHRLLNPFRRQAAAASVAQGPPHHK